MHWGYLRVYSLKRHTYQVFFLASCGKTRNQQFIACVNGSAIVSTPALISFGGIVPTPMVLLMSISFRSFFNSRSCYLFEIETIQLWAKRVFNTLRRFWFYLIILSLASLSFKDPSVVPILLGLFPQLFSAMLIWCLLNVCEISYSSVMIFFYSVKVMSLLAIIPLFVMKCLVRFQELLLVSIPFSETLSIYR